MGARRRRATRQLTAAAILVALGVVFLALGALVEVLDLSMAAVASLCVAFAVIELGGKWPYLIYFAISLLAVLLLPVKTPALLFALFAGYYPIVKALLERRFSRPVSWVFKILTFEVALGLILLLGFKLSSHMLAKQCSKLSKPGFNSM